MALPSSTRCPLSIPKSHGRVAYDPELLISTTSLEEIAAVLSSVCLASNDDTRSSQTLQHGQTLGACSFLWGWCHCCVSCVKRILYYLKSIDHPVWIMFSFLRANLTALQRLQSFLAVLKHTHDDASALVFGFAARGSRETFVPLIHPKGSWGYCVWRARNEFAQRIQHVHMGNMHRVYAACAGV